MLILKRRKNDLILLKLGLGLGRNSVVKFLTYLLSDPAALELILQNSFGVNSTYLRKFD